MHLYPSRSEALPKRISGPILDRIDIHIEVPRVNHMKLTDSRLGESSEAIRARQIQNQRINGSKGTYTNADA
jgi:magnesium chelatase family protein